MCGNNNANNSSSNNENENNGIVTMYCLHDISYKLCILSH